MLPELSEQKKCAIFFVVMFITLAAFLLGHLLGVIQEREQWCIHTHDLYEDVAQCEKDFDYFGNSG